jgi:outer membrane receptor protein involved in Fe transport
MTHSPLRAAIGALLALPVAVIWDPQFAGAQGLTDSSSVEEVVVTSSRIPGAELARSAPVLAMQVEELRLSGKTNMTEMLKELPALTNSLDSTDAAGPNAFIGGAGLTLLNLRNLGKDRTLVLVNGRRHVSSLPGSAAVDVETIPLALVERVEVQTGGASAIYGADGVSGVVNFVMRNRFDGLDSRLQFGRSSRGDADTRLASVVAGQNFRDERANVTLALEYASEDRVNQNQRNFTHTGRWLFVGNPADVGDIPGVPDQIPVRDIGYWDTSPAGAIYLLDRNAAGNLFFPDRIADFNGMGLPYDYGTVPPTGGRAPFPTLYQQGGDATRVALYAGDLLPEKNRYTANLFSDLILGDAARLFGELKYSRAEAFTLRQPTFDFYLLIQPDNPFVPPPIAAAAGGLPVAVSRDHFDLGTRYEDVTRATTRAVLGIDGAVTGNIRYEVSYVYGETDSKVLTLARLEDRFRAAIDAVTDPVSGQPTCRSTLNPNAAANARSFTPGPASGCVPISLFGYGAISAAGADWIMMETVGRSQIEQHVVQAYMAGDSTEVFELPAGPIGFALGAEWREESSVGRPPIENQLGLVSGLLLPSRGRYDVAEAFTEISIPLLRDRPFADALSIDGAFRISDYSTSGTAITWKAGLAWSPLRDFTLRGTIAEATRAPNIGELFEPGSQTFRTIADPCDATRLNQGSSARAANCAALLSSLGVDTSIPYQDLNTSSVAGNLRGNPDLMEEVARTKTLGFVLRPSLLPALSLGVDWYDIELTNAINRASPLEAAQICVDSPSIDNEFCGLITRTPGTGRIVGFVQQPQNVAHFVTEGFDLTMSYALDAGALGRFNLRLIGNKLEKLTFVHLPGAEPDVDLGEGGTDMSAPQWQANFDLTWQRGAVTVNYGFSFFDETLRYSRETMRANPDMVESRFRYFDHKLTQDIHGQVALANGLSIYAGINNFMDQLPDIGANTYPVSPLGRYWYAGLMFRGF